MIVQHTVSPRGYEYTYFFCRNKQDGTCPTPHVNVLRIEDAIEAHYATIQFTPDFIATVRTQLTEALADQEAAARLLHRQLTAELRALDVREDNLIDLAATADDTVPQAKAKIAAKLRDIEHQRARLTERLSETNDDLADGARLIDVCLKLLENSQELYRRCDDEQRRLLNQALFEGLYIDHDQVTGHDQREPFALLHRLQHNRHTTHADKPDPGAAIDNPHNISEATPRTGSGLTTFRIQALLTGIELDQGSNKTLGWS
jgi:hypothetical protein